jgi:hypothetical protein
MTARPLSRLLKYAVAVVLSATCADAALAQSHGSEALLSYANFQLRIPALKVGEKFYRVTLSNPTPPWPVTSWTLVSAVEIAAVPGDYTTGSYANEVLDLKCVLSYDTGNYYSARLVRTGPTGYSFTLASYTQLTSCPRPADIGPVRGQWVRTADSPLSGRIYAALAWTGEEIIVFGGWQFFCSWRMAVDCVTPPLPQLRDGAAYNPVTNSWRKIADAPLGSRNFPAPVNVGRDVYFIGQTTLMSPSPVRLLRYRSTQDRWDEFESPVSSAGAMAAFGNNLVLYHTQDATGSTPDWLFDSVTTQWTQLPADPLGPGDRRQYVALGTDLYLFERALTSSSGAANGPYLRAARLRGQQWTLLPVTDSVGSAPSLLAGRRLIAPYLGCAEGGTANGDGRCIPYGGIFDTDTDTWQQLSNAPGLGLTFLSSSGGLSDNDLELFSPGHPALDVTTNAWFMVPLLDADIYTQRSASMDATGPYGFAFGGVSGNHEFLKGSWIWKP